MLYPSALPLLRIALAWACLSLSTVAARVSTYRTYRLNSAQQQMLVNAHNRLRLQEPASNMQQMVWDEGLARLALERVQYCDADHSTSFFRSRKHGFKYIGENIWWSTEWWLRKNLDSIIQSFYDEKPDYTFQTTACVPGKMCGHYTQVVWANSCAVGCAAAACPRILNGWHIKSGHLVVCHYGPGGNYHGKRPYRWGSRCTNCKHGCMGNGFCRPACSGKTFTQPAVVVPRKKPRPVATQKARTSPPAVPKVPSPVVRVQQKAGAPDCSSSSVFKCEFWTSIGECQKNAAYMHVCCSPQCKVSPSAKVESGAVTAKEIGSQCIDRHALCDFWGRKGECPKNPSWMAGNCRKTCSASCNKQGQLLVTDGCADKDSNCIFWASIGECASNPDYMNWRCRRSCRQC